VALEDLPFEGGERWSVAALAQRFSALPTEVTGLTLSGGEPMAQAGALTALVDRLRTMRDWSVMAFSGFTLDWLRRRGDGQQRALLDRLDILVDGPYVAARHADLLWRGSANQRLHFLTARHQMPVVDRSAGLEINVSASTVDWIGVPPVPGFRAAFERTMHAEGVELRATEEDS
jgi:anaerobic ribonucleoside-triphosphate reductase activating protein